MNNLEQHLESIVRSWVDEHSWADERLVASVIADSDSEFGDSKYEIEEISYEGDKHKYAFTAKIKATGRYHKPGTRFDETILIIARGHISCEGGKANWIIDDEYEVDADIIINSPYELLIAISDIQSGLWYRGHADKAWGLKTSIARCPNPSLALERDLRLKFENETTFLDPALHPLEIGECNFLMQHHGLPTRLLDWSTSPLVAAYFAVCDDKKDNVDACIWQLDPSRLNRFHGYNESPVECNKEDYTKISNKTLAIHAPYTNLRMRSQCSEFTLHAHYDTIDNSVNASVFLKKITISKKIKRELRNKLSSLGINRGALFPDLDNIARTVADDLL